MSTMANFLVILCFSFSYFSFFWEGEILITRSNDNNLKEMRCPLHTMKLKLTTHLDRENDHHPQSIVCIRAVTEKAT